MRTWTGIGAALLCLATASGHAAEAIDAPRIEPATVPLSAPPPGPATAEEAPAEAGPAPQGPQATLPPQPALPPSPQPRAAPPAAPPAPAAAWSVDACKPIYKDRAFEVRNRLLSFESVYGKKVINWTEQDYNSVVALAQACNGVVIGGGDRFDSRPWPGMINTVRNRVLPIAQVARIIQERARKIVPEAIRLPQCEEFLDFKFDAYGMTDSSGKAFGKSFLGMSLGDLDRSVAYVNLCLAYLPDYAQIAGGWRKEVTRDLLNRIMDRALIVQKRRNDWEALPKYDTDLVLEQEGVVVPTTMTSPDAREMVSRYNKSSALRRPFSPEAIGQLIRMADEVLRDDRSAYDKLYASAVKARVQQEIFRKQ